jgi:hypothetical protein
MANEVNEKEVASLTNENAERIRQEVDDEEAVLEEEEEEQEEETTTVPVTTTAPATTAKPATFVRRRITRRKASAIGGEVYDRIRPDDDLFQFFAGRARDPRHYTYTPEGNLERKGVKELPDKVIQMEQKFVPLQLAQLEEILAERSKALKQREEAYEKALSDLRIAIDRYARDDATAETVCEANKRVAQASLLRSRTAYPEQWTTMIESISISEILMTADPFEKRKMPYPVFLFKHNDLSRKDAWGTYKGRAQTDEKDMEGGGIRIRFITDPEDKSTGHFHPFTPRNVTFHETDYCSPYQAYEGERFKELGADDLRRQILGTRSGRTMHSIAIKDKRLPNQPQQLWEDILFHYFHQHPDFAKELEATGTDKFHVMDKEIPAEYGPALEGARLRLRELGDKELDHQEVKEKAITEEEQKKAKVGAIIRNYRK